MRKKGLIALGLAAVMTASALTGCGGASDKKESDSKKEAKGTVYYLNFKPEADAQWQELADIYTEKTGVKVNVVQPQQISMRQHLRVRWVRAKLRHCSR